MPKAIPGALPVFYRSFLLQLLRQPGSLVVETLVPLGFVAGSCLFAAEPASLAVPFMAFGLPLGMVAASAWDFGVLATGGFWRRACVAPAGGTLVFAAVALSSLTIWLATSLAGYVILAAFGAADAAGVAWVLVAVVCLAPAFSALGLAVFAVLKNPVSAVTSAPFVYGALTLFVFAPSALERRLGFGGAAWVARLSPMDLELRLWRHACAPHLDPAGMVPDFALSLGFMLAGLFALRLLLKALRRS